jgi:hypothetical protein
LAGVHQIVLVHQEAVLEVAAQEAAVLQEVGKIIKRRFYEK